MLVVILLPMMLSGCTSFGAKVTPERSLPKAPSYMSPVELIEPKENADARVELAVCTGHVSKLNSRLVRSGEWYRSIQSDYSKK